MELILARHGNTFRSGEPVVWVGSQNDIPLVESGQNQAQLLGQALRLLNYRFDAVYTGPLARMRTFAQLLLKECPSNAAPVVDNRLNEIDYGQWSGLTSAQVCERFGETAFENWEKRSQWPELGGWGESETALNQRIQSVVKELLARHTSDEKILIVGSNGCLRYFLNLIPGEFQNRIQQQAFKMVTGSVSQLIFQNQQWQVGFWNRSAQQLMDYATANGTV